MFSTDYLDEVKRKYKGKDAAYDPDAFKDKATLNKIDAILLALSEAGYVVVPREATQATRQEMWIALGNTRGWEDLQSEVDGYAMSNIYEALITASEMP